MFVAEHTTPPNLFSLVDGSIFLCLESVVVDVSAVPVSSIAEYIHTQPNMYI